MTRGFITIATGKELYYQLAKNLLLSYRLFSREPLPFAILCDRETEETRLFDQTILFSPSGRPYYDKFELLKLAPFDETIFIDSDCLAYADLNEFWDFFQNAPDFSAAGTDYPLDSDRGLFRTGDLGPFRDRVHWKPAIHGGLYFIRKGPVCDAIYDDCQWIIRHHGEFTWPDYCAPGADEPILSLAMAANGCHVTAANPRNYGIPWEVTELHCDLFTGYLRYATAWHPLVDQGRMIHWSVRYCKKPLYRFEVEKLALMCRLGLKPAEEGVPLNLGNTLRYRWKLRYCGMLCWEFLGRAWRKVLRTLHIFKKED